MRDEYGTVHCGMKTVVEKVRDQRTKRRYMRDAHIVLIYVEELTVICRTEGFKI